MKTTIVIAKNLSKAHNPVIFVTENKPLKLLPEFKNFQEQINFIYKNKDFEGKKNTHIELFSDKQKLYLIGLGEADSVTKEDLRLVGGKLGQHSRSKKWQELSLFVEFKNKSISLEDALFTLTEGVILGTYSFDHLKNPLKKQNEYYLSKLTIMCLSNQAKTIGTEAINMAETVNMVRHLCFMPANLLTPTLFSKMAERQAKELGLTVKILSEKELEKENMRSFLSVSAGSDQEAKFVILEHKPKKIDHKETYVFVGKGVTFDTGGISLKPGLNMHHMKSDMSGAAAVFGLLRLVAEQNLPLHVVGLMPLTENIPNGKATKPGDVIVAKNGLSIEILNTDAEGRLILCDALTYAERYKPTQIIDIATLTGAMTVALGEVATGMMGNNQTLMDELSKAGYDSYERVWQLPLFEEYKEQLKSPAADLANIGGPLAGSITAALFLSYFTEKMNWAHLDIAGTSTANGSKSYAPKGSSGVGVRLFYQFLKNKLKSKK